MTHIPAFPAATVLGYPRIGRHRELKRALESFWAGRTGAAELERAAAELRRSNRRRLASLGLSTTLPAIPSDFSFYDHVLDTAVTVGAVPSRFAGLVPDGGLGLGGYSVLARGAADQLPLEMTKWFDTNYHYLVPEISPTTRFHLAGRRPLTEFREALAEGVLTRPVLLGPVTFLALSKPAADAPEGFAPLDRLDDLLVAYGELLAELSAAGATWVQLDEPALVSDATGTPRSLLEQAASHACTVLADLVERPAILLAAPYGALRPEALEVLAASGVEGLALDLVRGGLPPRRPEVPVLVGGVVDGRNVWRQDLGVALDRLEALAGGGPVAAGTSCSLLHVPHDVELEDRLDPALRSWLAFADQKVADLVTLGRALTEGRAAVAGALAASQAAREARAAADGVVVPAVRERVAALTEDDTRRAPYPERAAAQREHLALPPLPTTTIGSFPQTPEIRRARAARARGELDEAAYTEAMRAEIRRVVALQEEIGLDVLVHGEPERNDMVQYFAEHLTGFAVTEHGWVQSYGSRCTRPPVLWGDVSRPEPVTVPWTAYTASLTSRPVKGMLTGPVTILAWSFVRDDLPLEQTAAQVALALREELADLEAAGIGVVQVDEPALRELLPLEAARQEEYLAWAVRAFHIATGGAAPRTQVHTHLCYSEFGAVLGAIDALDADVTSIEAARSKMEIVEELGDFARGVGPGVYDIHSPRVPDEEEVAGLLRRALDVVPPERLWVNPDCGLKTRRYEEVEPALRNLVAAARRTREGLAQG
mgnify:CR=1 FL=1